MGLTVRNCQQVLQRSDSLGTFLEIQAVEPTNIATVDEVYSP